MAERIHRYAGQQIEVTYDAKRCIHAAECVRGLPQVFDTAVTPWVKPDNAGADRVAEVILRCPTGALHFRRRDGGAEETTPATNSVRIEPNGPLYLRGEIRIEDEKGKTIIEETRVALCRCGATKRSPLCDGSHREVGFRDAGVVAEQARSDAAEMTPSGHVAIVPSTDGPLLVTGVVEVAGGDSSTAIKKDPTFCRCGASGSKPFCDGSHHRVHFKSA